MIRDELNVESDDGVRNQSLLREVNERVDELNGQFARDGFGVPQYLCECVDLTCGGLIAVSHDEYRRVRRHPEEFIVSPGHEQPSVEEVVHRGTRWVVVRRLASARTPGRTNLPSTTTMNSTTSRPIPRVDAASPGADP